MEFHEHVDLSQIPGPDPIARHGEPLSKGRKRYEELIEMHRAENCAPFLPQGGFEMFRTLNLHELLCPRFDPVFHSHVTVTIEAGLHLKRAEGDLLPLFFGTFGQTFCKLF